MSTRFSLSVANERADAGWDGQICLARPNSQARTRVQGNINFPCSADHEQVWQPYPIDLNSAVYDEIVHRYILC